MQKFILLVWIAIGFLGFIFPGVVQGQEKAVETEIKQPIVVATVNVENPQLIKQEGIQYTIGFDVSNREKSQGEIHYAINLQDEKKRVIDRKFYDEVFSLNANEKQHKEVIYNLPSGLSPKMKYTLFAEAVNSQGLQLGMAFIANINPEKTGTRPQEIMNLTPKADPKKVAILNILLDKDAYQAKDIAQVSFFG